MRPIRVPLLAAAALLAVPAAASAHVTVKPGEARADSFTTLVVIVPNERDDASTVKVTVKFPEEITSVSFQPKPGWKRIVSSVKLDQPIADEGGQITERIDTVTWTSAGAKIGPGEFDEFGVSVHVPADEGATLEFPAVQTYSNGEVVRWIGGDEPAPSLAVTAAEGDGHGGGAETPAAEEPAAAPADTAAADEDGNRATMALGVGAAGLIAGIAGLAAALRRR
jgi:uncharacterized protein YcnI